MKKFIGVCITIILLVVLINYLIYTEGWYIDFKPNTKATTFVKTIDKSILINKGGTYENFIIKGVDLDASIPGHKYTDFAIDEETYLRWFSLISEMGANTIRIYTIMNDTFYDALYKFNTSNEKPLYLLQGLWVTDYANNSSYDALSNQFKGMLQQDAYNAVDIIHGRKNLPTSKVRGSGIYRSDISEWVLGYILGLDWNAKAIAYTDNINKGKEGYIGEYFYTSQKASVFESMLAEIMDKTVEYESKKYKQQRLISFMNNPSTDPFEYDYKIAIQIDKYASLDFEHIVATNRLESGYFASYKLFEFCPQFIKHFSERELSRLKDIVPYIDSTAPYYGYLELLGRYHTMPVVIAGYGFSSARGSSQIVNNGSLPKGGLTENDQAEALASTYFDIIDAGLSGAIITSWQDVWAQRSSNTMHAVDITRASEWSDYQTSDQFYGLLSFDPGDDKSICYVDGDISEWSKHDIIINSNDMSLSAKYDEKFIYLMIKKENLVNSDTLYIPIDITPKTGSNYCEEFKIKFDRNSDFILNINGEQNSRLLVHERYDILRESSLYTLKKKDPFIDIPPKDTPVFNKIYMIATGKKIKENLILDVETYDYEELYGLYESGLLKHGNANPSSEDYNSLADFIIKGNYIEIRIPWQLLNFSSPSRMMIHDDYYENYGVENLKIKKIYFGVAEGKKYMPRIEMSALKLKGWKSTPTYHERLKKSYYVMQKIWND